MDFEAFKALKAESETETFFDQLMRIHREIDRIDCLYSGYPVDSKTTLQQTIQAWFDGLNEDQKADPIQPARGYLSNLKEHQLEPLEANSAILEAVLSQMKYEEDDQEWLRPAMSSLLNKSTQDLQTIQGALSNLDKNQFNTFLDNFDTMASRIAGQNRNRLTDTYKILMDKLAEHDGKADIRVQLNAAYDEVAQKCQNLNPLQRSLSVLKGLLLREPSLQNLPQTLVNPFASEAPEAVSDASATPAAPEAEAEAATPPTPAPAPAPTPTPAAPSRSPSRGRMPFKRIAATTFLGGIGVVGLGGLVSWIAQGFKPAPTTTPPAAAPTPPNLEAARAAEIEKLNRAINWRNSNTGPVHDPNAIPLGKLQEYQALGGKSAVSVEVDGVNVSEGTLSELQSIANQAGIRSDRFQGMVEAYENGYRRFNINPKNHDPDYADEKAKALAASLEAVRDYIKNEQARAASPVGWLQDRFGDATDNIASAFTKTAERVVGSIPINSSVAAEGPPAMVSSTAPTHGPSSPGVLGQGFGIVSATMATVQLVSTWKNIDNNERLLLAAQATAGVLAAAGKTNPALTSALFVANTVRASTAEAYETRTTTLATKEKALQSTLAIQADTLSSKATKYAAVAWNAFQVTGATVSVVQSVAANGVRDLFRSEENRVVQPMVAEKVGQARDAVVHQASQMLTQAQGVAENAMETASNAFQSAQERTANMFANLFTQRQAAVL